MEFNLDKKPNIPSTEELRAQYAEKVKNDLEKYIDQITQFNLVTSNKTGFWDTNEGIKPVQYDDRYKEFFELHGVTHPEELLTNSGFIYDKELRKVTFTGYLGRTLENNGKRDGNGLFITIKFSKEFNPSEIIKNISQLLDTLIAYRGNDTNTERTAMQDLSDIAREGIQILEAFKKVSQKFPSNGHISLEGMIEEYKEILKLKII